MARGQREKQRAVGIRLPDSLHRKLAVKAKQNHRSLAAETRLAIEKHLERAA